MTRSEKQDPEIHEMQTQWLEDHRLSNRWMIVETGEGFEVHVHTADGVHPQSVYPTKRRAIARLMQLLKTGVVAPQTWPETACIGRIDAEPEP